MELQELKLWGITYKNMQEETGLKWEDDQERILKKLKEIKI